MITFNELMIAMLVIVFIVLGSVVVGGWLVFSFNPRARVRRDL